MSERPLRPIMIVPDFDRIGGYERQAFFLTRHCIERGIASLIVTNRPPGLPARELRDGVVIHRLDSLPPTRPNWANVFKSFLRFLDSHRDEYDVIHCHAMTFLSACCVVIGKLLSKPVLIKVATEQDVREFHTNKKLGFRVFYPLVRRADRFLSLTESIRAEFRACGFDDRRVVLVHNGVESRLFDRARPEQRKRERRALGVEDGRFQFLFSGRLVHRKGVDVLLDAMSLARRTDFEVLILGDGEERRRLEARARRLEVSGRVRFLGEHEDVGPFLAASDAFVFPSRLEGLPNALLEAMSSGLPAIATRIGGCTDVITQGSGLLVAPDDAAGLARAMDRVATDASLRARLSEGARARVLERFSFDVIVDELQDIYRDALAEMPG